MHRVADTSRYVATNLGAVLQSQGRKQCWLARQLGVSAAYVSLIVAGERTVDRATGERVALLLGVPFSLLFALG